ncbi:MAG TPA: ADP-ribosylation factor-like protein [Candidatus Deferrimicrobium sp.]|nr:ADP-ribosylation factor-like protein [Candidatus Deferrimicrobium sp.]
MSSKILNLINIAALPKDAEKLLDEPISIIKNIDEKDFKALEQHGIKKIKDLIQIKDIEKVQKSIDSLSLEKMVTTARIIENIVRKKTPETGKKLLMAGLDAAGKTTILRTILDPLNYKPGDEKPTKGLEFRRWELFGFDKINLWDLGGQKVYRTEYLADANTERHFGFTHLFIYVIDIQAEKRYQEAYDYLKRIIEIFHHLDEEPYCLILIHKSDPSLDPKKIQKHTQEIIKMIEPLLTVFPKSFHNTSVYDRGSLFTAFSKGLRDISMVKPVLSGILNIFQKELKSTNTLICNKIGICVAETGDPNEILRNFTINVILGEELGIFPGDASKLILVLKNNSLCIMERIEGNERFYMAWLSNENPELLMSPPIIKELEPWILNFLQ